MIYRLDPRIPVVWRDPWCIQLGVDVPVCTLPGASNATQRMLAALAVGAPRSALVVIATAAGGRERDVDALLGAIRPALLDAGLAVVGTERARVRPLVALDGVGPVVPLLHRFLDEAGIDCVDIEHLGHRRADAAVIAAHYAISPERHARWLRADLPHLPIVFGDRFVRLGPLVEPGKGPCQRCVDLAHVDADSAWPALATQLVERQAPAETAVASADAAVRATRMLANRLRASGFALAADAGSAVARERAASTVLLIETTTGTISERVYAPHERCGCRALPENVTRIGAQPDRSPARPNSIAGAGAPG